MMTDEWVKSVNLDAFECAKRMMVVGKQLCQKTTGKYKTTNLCTPYRIIALMVINRMFGQENGKFYNMSWIPLTYHVDIQGTIFNWVDIVETNLLSCIATAQGGLTKKS